MCIVISDSYAIGDHLPRNCNGCRSAMSMCERQVLGHRSWRDANELYSDHLWRGLCWLAMLLVLGLCISARRDDAPLERLTTGSRFYGVAGWWCRWLKD